MAYPPTGLDAKFQRELESIRVELEQVRQENQRLRHVLEQSHLIAGIAFWESSDTRLTWHSSLKAVRELLGCVPANPDEWLNLIHTEDQERVKSVYDHARDTVKQIQIDYRITLANEQVRHVQEIGLPTYNSSGEFDGYHGTIQDNSERKLYEQRHEHLIDDLKNRNRQLDQFTHALAHNLKAPLVTVSTFAGLLRADIESGDIDKTLGDITRIRATTEKMRVLLDELLKRARAGRFGERKVDTALNTLIDDVTVSIRGVLEDLSIDVAPKLPLVYGDRTRLTELVQILIENAARFTYNASEPRVEISATVSEREVQCCVADNGIGIEPIFHDKIFRPFETLDSERCGTGLGLSLARQIVEWHGGQIRVESTGANKGSKFYFTLPKRDVHTP